MLKICGDVLSRELFLSGIMIFLAKMKAHNALMNFLNASIYGPVNCSALQELYLNFEFSFNVMAVKEERQAYHKAYFYLIKMALNIFNIC